MPTETCPQECPTYSRQPASLPLAFTVGDDFPFLLRFNRNLTGYTLAASITCVETGAAVCSFTIATTGGDLGLQTIAGQQWFRVRLSLTEQQTALVVPPLNYRWSFQWTDTANDTRTIFSGRVRAMRR